MKKQRIDTIVLAIAALLLAAPLAAQDAIDLFHPSISACSSAPDAAFYYQINSGNDERCQISDIRATLVDQIFACANGDCSALTAASGDSLDMGSADSSRPATRSTTVPATCSEGQLHQDTDSGGLETYICTATNTWRKIPWDSSTSPTPTTEGDAEWDSDDDVLRIGDGSTTRTLYPGFDPEMRRMLYDSDECLYTSPGSRMLASVTSGSGTSAKGTGEAQHPGICSFATGNTAGGAAGLQSDFSMTTFGGATWIFETVLKTPSSLSDGTNSYWVQAGFRDGLGSTTNAVQVRYTHSNNSGKWEGDCRNNSVSTVVDTGVTVTTSTWYRLRIECDAAGSSCTFYVNGTNGGSCASNIPTAAGRETGLNIAIVKFAGTTSRTLLVDYAWVRAVFTTAR